MTIEEKKIICLINEPRFMMFTTINNQLNEAKVMLFRVVFLHSVWPHECSTKSVDSKNWFSSFFLQKITIDYMEFIKNKIRNNFNGALRYKLFHFTKHIWVL